MSPVILSCRGRNAESSMTLPMMDIARTVYATAVHPTAPTSESLPTITTATMTITETRPTTHPQPVTEDGDHDRFAHYTRKSDTVRAYVEGTPVQALCGKIWVPSRDPDLYPVCPTCAKIKEHLMSSADN